MHDERDRRVGRESAAREARRCTSRRLSARPGAISSGATRASSVISTMRRIRIRIDGLGELHVVVPAGGLERLRVGGGGNQYEER